MAGTTETPCRYGVLDSVGVTVVVEDAVGTAAPMPYLVTDDFVWTFRVEFDTLAATARSSTGEVCDYPVCEKVSLHLTQTAADYAYDANALCPCWEAGRAADRILAWRGITTMSTGGRT